MKIFKSPAALLGIILGASCLVLVGCSATGAGTTPKSTDPSPATTASPAVTTPAPSAALETVRVVRTIDGDTIEVEGNSKQRVQVRLIGIFSRVPTRGMKEPHVFTGI
jgi:hypothetical protein